MRILVFNIGSSTNKLALFDIEEGQLASPQDAVWESTAQASGDKREEVLFEQVGNLLLRFPLKSIEATAHRIVHGGPRFTKSAPIEEAVLSEIARLSLIAPLHNPAALDGIRFAMRRFASCPHVAVFDTAAHGSMPEEARIYALPYDWYIRHDIRRYGFHGINHNYAAHRTAHLVGTNLTDVKIVTCHLGSGASLAAFRGGCSVDTTMGFTPLAGLVMGSRCGDVDPGILLYAMQHMGLSAGDLDRVLNRESGLLGLSGRTSDMKELLALCDEGDERAVLTLRVYVHRLRCAIGQMVASMDGIDALTFTGGVGENASYVRELTVAGLGFLKASLDREANDGERGDRLISNERSGIRIAVVEAREDFAIARQCLDVLQSS